MTLILKNLNQESVSLLFIERKTGKRAFKGICLNQAKEMANDYEISGKTSSQIIDECLDSV